MRVSVTEPAPQQSEVGMGAEGRGRKLERSMELLARERKLIGNAFKIRFFPLTVAATAGARIWDLDGNEYLDAMGAASVAGMGYRHGRIREAIVRTLDTQWFSVTPCAASESPVELAERLLNLVGGERAKKVWLGLSGSEAMDCLFKLVPLAAEKPRVITFIGGFAGSTIGASMISGQPVHTAAPGSPTVTKVPYPDPYCCAFGCRKAEECCRRCLQYIEDFILKAVSPAEETAAIFVEAIQADNGCVVPPDGFLPGLRDLCNRHGMWLLLDEVKTGLGRTGAMFAYEHSEIEPDGVVLGKALGGGLPLSAIVARREILDVGIPTNSTMGGAPTACAAAIEVLDIIADEGLVERARRGGVLLLKAFAELAREHPLIGDYRGRGLELGIELVANQRTREPAFRDAARVVYRCFELGLIVSYSGIHGNVLEFSPPLIISDQEIDDLVAILDQAIGDVERGDFDDSKLRVLEPSLGP